MATIDANSLSSNSLTEAIIQVQYPLSFLSSKRPKIVYDESYIHFVACVSTVKELKSYLYAIEDSNRVKAMEAEL